MASSTASQTFFSAAQLKDALHMSLMTTYRWYERLHPEPQKPETHFIYEFDPLQHSASFRPCPVRDIGTIYDVGVLSSFLRRAEFKELLHRSLGSFLHKVEQIEAKLPPVLQPSPPSSSSSPLLSHAPRVHAQIFDSHALGEPAHIGHNGLMVLSVIEYINTCDAIEEPLTIALRQWYTSHVSRFASAIVAQQRLSSPQDSSYGSYKVFFGHEKDVGVEFYASEALLGLARAYMLTRNPVFLRSAELALPWYKRYYMGGNVSDDMIVFFANWQSQAALQLHRFTADESLKREIEDFVLPMYDKIIQAAETDDNSFYAQLKDRPESVATVEAACFLEGLADAFALELERREPPGAAVPADQQATESAQNRRATYREAISNALNFLLSVQLNMKRTAPFAFGGYAHGLSKHTQRLDVTGHVLCAFTKLWHVLDRHAHPRDTFSIAWDEKELHRELSSKESEP